MRLASPHAAAVEVSGRERHWLVADAGRGSAGLYLLDRAQVRETDAPGDSGRAHQALLLLRKHLSGARLSAISRVAGERWLVLEAGAAQVALRPGGPSPALTLALDGAAAATLGEGAPAWPPPAPDPAREWDQVDAQVIEEARLRAAESGRVGALLAACPGLGPELARALLRGAISWPRLRAELAAPRPTLRAPAPPEAWHDADLADEHALALLPLPLEAGGGGVFLQPASWTEGARLLWTARGRGRLFAARRREIADHGRRAVRRLAQLRAHLERDLAGLPDAEALRRQAEALLAYGAGLPPGTSRAELPDPRDPERTFTVHLDTQASAPAQADRWYARARRVERARGEVAARLERTGRELGETEQRLAALEAARDLAELGPPSASAPRPPEKEAGGPRHYLTSRGLSLFVGRGARENHELTFGQAGPEDYWLHARDVPGAHVILRDRDGRAQADDLREAAEVAAFFSGARQQGQADVHLARRKHVRSAGGGPGRVQVLHGETVRVRPRDPEGRLRRR